jgi:hypothetical protein
MGRRRARIVIPAAAGAVLLGGAGWFAGPLWAVAGALGGPVVACAVLLTIMWRRRPDPARLLRDGRPDEAYLWLEEELSFMRGLAARRPMFRDVLAYKRETMARVLQALDNEPRAAEAAAKAAAIFAELADKRPDQYGPALAASGLKCRVSMRTWLQDGSTDRTTFGRTARTAADPDIRKASAVGAGRLRDPRP